MFANKRGWWSLAARCLRGVHGPAAIISTRTVSLTRAVALARLLACKRGPKIGVPIADQRGRTFGNLRRQLMIAGAAPLWGYESAQTIGGIALNSRSIFCAPASGSRLIVMLPGQPLSLRTVQMQRRTPSS